MRPRLQHLLLASLCLYCSEPAPPAPPPSAGGSAGSGTPAVAGHGGSLASSGGVGGAGAASAGNSSPVGGFPAADGGGGGDAGEGAHGGDAAIATEPEVTWLGEAKLTGDGLSLVSYGGYLNGESFQQDAILTYDGYQYAAYWNTSRHVVLARRALRTGGAFQSFELTDYTNTANDAHNTISLGVTAADGTLHLAFDHHGSPLHYRKSVARLLTAPDSVAWSAESFSPVTSELAAPVKDFTYPRFVSVPGRETTLLSGRVGTSGSGDEHLWEYSGVTHAWTELGRYIDGRSDDINAYLHGIAYTPGQKRLHVAWCWRDTPDASSNHDLLYAYSDDDGRTWNNDAGARIATTGANALHAGSPGLAVATIAPNRGLINQEHLTVDAAGRVHVLLSHLPAASEDDSDFNRARSKSRYYHYVREAAGKWSQTSLEQPALATFRGKLAVTTAGNLYAILPGLRIAGAAATPPHAWQLLHEGESDRFFSDPLVDAARLPAEGVLSVLYPARMSGDIFVVDFRVR